jgi:hypothetical protein
MPPKVFISYSHEDERWKELLVKQLGVLEREGLVETWHDGLIRLGTDWLPAIEASMAGARVAVLIVSADFLNSDFIRRREIPLLLDRRTHQDLLVIPIIARPCMWRQVPWLAAMQALPGKGKSLAELGAVKAEKALSELAGEILQRVPPDGPSPTPRPQTSEPAPLPAPPAGAGGLAARQFDSPPSANGHLRLTRTAWIALIALLAVGTLTIFGIRASKESGLYLRMPVRAHQALTAPMLEAVKGKAPKIYGPQPVDFDLVVGTCAVIDLEQGHRLVTGDFEACKPSPNSSHPSHPQIRPSSTA